MASISKYSLWLLFVVCAVSFQLALSGCPRGWITAGTGSNTGCYKIFSSVKKNFNAAQRYCTQQHGFLARDLSSRIHNTLKPRIRNERNSAAHPNSFWIGLTDNNKNSGPWVWVGGPNLGSFKYFVSNPKNTPNKQDCFFVVPAEPSVKWHVTNNCNAIRSVICQRSLTSTPKVTTPKPIRCARGWTAQVSQKTCFRLYTQPKIWTDARTYCQNAGGDLVKIANSAMNGFVNALVAKQRGTYWIGLHDRHQENKFEWLDEDTKASFTYWNAHEPNNAGGNENCVSITSTRSFKWNDARCTSRYRFICQQAPVNSGPPPKTTPKPPVSRNCGAGWEDDPNTDNCYQINADLLSWDDARANCKASGGDLATISSVQEQYYLSGRSLAFDSDFLWIGANDKATETGWKWADNSPFNFLNWDVRQPNNAHNSDCVAMVKKTGRWDDLPCKSRYGYICEKKGRITSPTPRPTTSPARLPSDKMWGCQRGWRNYRGSCYQVLRSPSGIDWVTASSVCSARLASLVAITDRPENQFVYTLIPKNYSGYIWLGLNDRRQENSFMWSDNTPVTYTYWSPHEPNNLGDEDCVLMYGRNGKWNDARCSTKAHLLICKKPKGIQPKGGLPEQQGCPTHAIGYEALCYSFIYQPPKNFAQAQQYCRSKGGNLATVDSGHVQAFIGAEMYHLPGASYWIGLSSTSQTSNAYAWTSGSTVDFTSWYKSHTGNEKNTCVAMRTARPAGLWVNYPCTTSMPYICETPRKGFTTARPTTTTTSKLPCSPGWWGWGNLCYKGFVLSQDSQLSWSDARDYCGTLADGGGLVTIRSKPFETWLMTKLLKNATGHYWIGFNDRDSEVGHVWQDKSPVVYVHWAPNEPNDYQNREDCVEWILPQNYWNDKYCYQAKNFICQVPRGAVISTPRPTMTPGISTLQCGNTSWTEYNNNCYFISPPDGDMARATWFESRLICLDMGGDLVSILSDDENGYMTTMISQHPVYSFWTGLNDLDQDTYEWSDMNPLSYISWGKNEPNDAYGAEKCVEMNSNGFWNDQHCQEKRGYVCKKRPGDFTPNIVNPTVPTGGCPRGFHSLPFLSKCYYVGGTTQSDRKSYEDAIVACGQMVHKSLLASIHTSLEEKYVTTLLAGLKWPAWVGLNDRKRRNQFQWIDNSKVDYTFWGWKQPDENLNSKAVNARRDCVDMEISPVGAGKWNDKNCKNKYAYVCESLKGSTFPTEAPNRAGCTVKGYQRFQDSCYKYSDDAYTWTNAELLCTNDGGHLVGIQNRMEQSFVELISNKQNSVQMWIGMSYSLSTDTYSWANGWPVKFTNWGHGEPDRVANEGCVSHTVDGRWQDVPCQMTLPFVCEISLVAPPSPTPQVKGTCPKGNWTTYGDYCYQLETVNTVIWPDANRFCNLLGGQLASIHSDGEAKFLTTMLTQRGVDAWIGLRKGQGYGFAWSDRTPVEYLYWAQGEPSDDDSYMHQDCVTASGQDGTWRDTDCFDINAYICKVPLKTNVVNRGTVPNGIVVTFPPQGSYVSYGPVNPGGNNPGGYNPGGNNPGGYNPGGNNPGGYNPGGNNPGGYNPGGNNPGGYNPGGNNPGGYNPGGNNPGGNIPGAPGQTGKSVGSSDNSSSGLSGGGVAGVVIGTIAIVAIAATVAFLGRRYLMNQTPGGPMTSPSSGFDNATYHSHKGDDKVALSSSYA